MHPFLLAAAPLLSLFAHNIDYLELGYLVRPLVVVGALVLFLFLISFLLFRSARKAAVLTSSVIVPLTLAGHLDRWQLGEGGGSGSVAVAAGAYGCAVAIIVVSFMALRRSHRDLRSLTAILNVVALGAVVIPLARIATFETRYWRASRSVAKRVEVADAINDEMSNRTDLPNIYYILLDGYTREDVFRYLFEFDNGDLVRYLEDKGFYVAKEATSNYVHTVQSLASILNFNYLDVLLADMPEEVRTSRRGIDNLFRESKVVTLLKRHGYRYVYFDSGFFPTNDNVDVTMNDRGGFSLFENEVIAITPLWRLLAGVKDQDGYAQHAQRIRYAFEHLGETAMMRGPVFVFAHILAAHPPFVFDADGNRVQFDKPYDLGVTPSTNQEFIAAYKGQVSYINGLLKQSIDDILQRSPSPPVIVISGDHGSRLLLRKSAAVLERIADAFPILNAYYLPGDGETGLYPGITPVNSFRIVFNRYLGTDFAILRDKCFYSPAEEKWEFENVDRRLIHPSRGVFEKARQMRRFPTTRR